MAKAGATFIDGEERSQGGCDQRRLSRGGQDVPEAICQRRAGREVEAPLGAAARHDARAAQDDMKRSQGGCGTLPGRS